MNGINYDDAKKMVCPVFSQATGKMCFCIPEKCMLWKWGQPPVWDMVNGEIAYIGNPYGECLFRKWIYENVV